MPMTATMAPYTLFILDDDICDIRTRDWNHSNPQLKTILSSFAVCNRKTDEGLSEKVP